MGVGAGVDVGIGVSDASKVVTITIAGDALGTPVDVALAPQPVRANEITSESAIIRFISLLLVIHIPNLPPATVLYDDDG